MRGKTVAELKIGDYSERAKTVTETDLYLYAGITGDFNPVNVNAQAAADSIYKERIVHGTLTAGLISAVLGNQLPGPGTICLSQNLQFRSPVKIGDTITVRAEVMDRNVDSNRATFRAVGTNQDGRIVVEGEVLVMPPKAF